MKRLAGVLAGCWLVAPAAGAAAAEPPGTVQTMGGIFDAMVVLLPASLDDRRFGDPAEREKIRGALARLAEHGAELERGAHASDASFAFLAGALARDTRDSLQRFEAGRVSESRYLLRRLVDDCQACHSRLPDEREHPLGQRLLAVPTIAALPPYDLVDIEVATRQWERALATYEALFAGPEPSVADLDLGGKLDSYLEVCLRVENDPARPIATFQKLAARSDVPPAVGAAIRSWIASLRQLRAAPPATTLESAQRLVSLAGDRTRYADDRAALVPYVAASGVLHRYVDQGAHSNAELGRAYYLLGVVESRVGRTFWLSQTEHFLEASIRIDPKGPSARDAYKLLEEFEASGYTGSGGGAVPEDVQRRLRSLRALIDAQPSS